MTDADMERAGEIADAQRAREVALCSMSFFCGTPMTCHFRNRCSDFGVTRRFYDSQFRALGQPSLAEQQALSDIAVAKILKDKEHG